MPRRRPPRRPERARSTPRDRVAPLPPIEPKRDGAWHVRALTGSSSTREYTCPECHRPIPPATPHVVAWPVQKALLTADAVDERRHWHTACWRRRP